MTNKQLLAKLAIDKSLLKEYSNNEYSRIVYMDNNSEFQIQIFNPYTYTIGAVISIDNKSLGNTLIIKPGERIWLERYLSEARKFLFSTYEVSGTNSEVKKAIEKNGEIEIKFYKEKEKMYIPSSITYINSNPWFQPLKYDVTQPLKYEVTCDAATNLYNSNISADLSSHVSKGLGNVETFGFADDCSLELSSVKGTRSMSKTTLNNFKSQAKNISCKVDNKIETGRVEKGSHSDQQFYTMDIDFEYFPFSTEIIKILPTSQKPVYKNDLTKQYCSNCGRKLNTKYKFCPYCGAKVEFCPNNKKGDYEIVPCPYCGRNVRSNMMECPHCGEILR